MTMPEWPIISLDVHDGCGIRFDGAPPPGCPDPGMHRNYAIVPTLPPPVPRPDPEPFPDLVLSQLTLDAIQAEATRAHLRHGANSMLGTGHSHGDRLAILTEETGEVARELNEARIGGRDIDRDHLVTELTQVAAMAATWIEALEGGAR
jgi:hypothetical protein